MIYFDEERLPTADIYIAPETYTRRKELMHERFEQMLHYAEQQNECRSLFISQYFGDKHDKPCGVCDICLARRKAQGDKRVATPDYRGQILALLSERAMTPKEIADTLSGNDETITEQICALVAEGTLYTRDMSGKLLLKKQ